MTINNEALRVPNNDGKPSCEGCKYLDFTPTPYNPFQIYGPGGNNYGRDGNYGKPIEVKKYCNLYGRPCNCVQLTEYCFTKP